MSHRCYECGSNESEVLVTVGHDDGEELFLCEPCIRAANESNWMHDEMRRLEQREW